MNEHSTHPHATTHHIHFDSPEAAVYAELEGEVLHGMVKDATAVLARLANREGPVVRRVLDLGCGPGVGSCLLAERFGAATVVAVDGSSAMLEKAVARAERLGLGHRVQTRRVDFPDGFAALGSADIVWASMVLHHIGDEADALRRIRQLLEPDGLLAVVERAEPLRIEAVQEHRARPGLWERLDAAWETWFAGMRDELPGATTSGDYPEMLEEAGFELVADMVLTLVLEPPADEPTRRFAHAHLARTRAHLAQYADVADMEALDALLDEHIHESILHRDDFRLRVTRRLHVARASSSAPADRHRTQL